MTIAIQRPLKGSRISSFYPVKSLPPLSSLDSAFQLQEYISLLIRLDVHDVEAIVSIPGKADSKEGVNNDEQKREEKEAEKEAGSNVTVDEACWIYEQLRRLAQDLSHPLITMLQQECTRGTCPEMKAGEWLYLCVAHGNEGTMEQCCAIDYILHTLDSATALLNSPRAFPSRLSIPQTSHRHFSSLARRLGRIFAHAYFHHREAFEQAEAESSLYARFLALTSKFDLVPSEFLVIPPRMTSMSMQDDDKGRRGDMDFEPPRLMAAAIDPQRERERENEQNQWLRLVEETGIGLSRDRRRSPPGPSGPGRNESPRKVGRSRTDTMVYSEAYTVVEELAKADASEAELERAIEAERKAEPADTNVSEPSGEHALPETPATNTAESLVTELREPSPPLSEPPALGVDMNPPDSAPVSAVDDTATSVDEPLPPPLPSIDVLPPSNMVEIPEAPALELSVDEATPSASLTERSHSPQKDSEATIEATIEADTDASPEVKEVSPTVEGEEQMQTEEVQITEARSSTESATDEPQAESVSDTLESLAQQEPPVVPSSEEPLVPDLPDQHPPEKVTPAVEPDHEVIEETADSFSSQSETEITSDEALHHPLEDVVEAKESVVESASNDVAPSAEELAETHHSEL